ncbi:MAG: hypothetical protein WCB49_03460 [Gammaproteobacteria bacterium]
MKMKINHRILAVAGAAAFCLSMVACVMSPDQQAAKSNGPHQVCTYQSSVGSHIGNRVCMSRSAYDEQQQANQKKTQTQADQSNDAGGPPSSR